VWWRGIALDVAKDEEDSGHGQQKEKWCDEEEDDAVFEQEKHGTIMSPTRAMKREWPADWTERVRGKDCAMCADGRAEVAHGSSRIFAGRVSDAYLVRNDVGQRGYCVVIWRGRHVSDPTELSADEARDYFDEVLRVGRAIERQYKPIKMNFEMLGNSVPHLHTHVIPRYLDDGEPGHPAHFMRIDLKDEPKISDDEYERDLAGLRVLLTSS
jgi:diadenosine tetraphosphate (Ap4A) HIT family hydrolase